jgi:hypothetical protein
MDSIEGEMRYWINNQHFVAAFASEEVPPCIESQHEWRNFPGIGHCPKCGLSEVTIYYQNKKENKMAMYDPLQQAQPNLGLKRPQSVPASTLIGRIEQLEATLEHYIENTNGIVDRIQRLEDFIGVNSGR